VAGYEGNAVVRTPVLDELARTGVVFRNCYTPSPICIPSRQAMMSGQLPKTCGVRSFGQDLPPNYGTWSRVFTKYAYETVCCGKLHHMGPDQMQGWRRRISFDDIHVERKFIDSLRTEEAERYRLPSQKWSDAKEVLRAGVGKSPHAVSDDFSVAAARQFIEQFFASPYYDRERPIMPLLLKVSLLLPHYPYLCDEDKFTYYLNRVTPYVDEACFDHPFLSQHAVAVGTEVTRRDIRRATAAYYGMVETIDAQYGSVLQALRHVGQDPDDWIIVYTSDHGEMLGQHGIWEKQKFFEASARVPLIIRWPKRFQPHNVDENVNLCDLYATLCDLAGFETPGGLDSRSMVPLLEGRTWAQPNESISQFGMDNLMIKQDHLKYQYYGEQSPEMLFDLKANPAETVNFINDPSYSDPVKRFRRRRGELGYGPGYEQAPGNAGYAP
jgi:choline-sulfatase